MVERSDKVVVMELLLLNVRRLWIDYDIEEDDESDDERLSFEDFFAHYIPGSTPCISMEPLDHIQYRKPSEDAR